MREESLFLEPIVECTEDYPPALPQVCQQKRHGWSGDWDNATNILVQLFPKSALGCVLCPNSALLWHLTLL